MDVYAEIKKFVSMIAETTEKVGAPMNQFVPMSPMTYPGYPNGGASCVFILGPRAGDAARVIYSAAQMYFCPRDCIVTLAPSEPGTVVLYVILEAALPPAAKALLARQCKAAGKGKSLKPMTRDECMLFMGDNTNIRKEVPA